MASAKVVYDNILKRNEYSIDNDVQETTSGSWKTFSLPLIQKKNELSEYISYDSVNREFTALKNCRLKFLVTSSYKFDSGTSNQLTSTTLRALTTNASPNIGINSNCLLIEAKTSTGLLVNVLELSAGNKFNIDLQLENQGTYTFFGGRTFAEITLD